MRKASFTTAEESEIQLDFIKDYGPTHKETGEPGVLFYDPERYVVKQRKYGKDLYPDPEPHPQGNKTPANLPAELVQRIGDLTAGLMTKPEFPSGMSCDNLKVTNENPQYVYKDPFNMTEAEALNLLRDDDGTVWDASKYKPTDSNGFIDYPKQELIKPQ